jgi:hypothetical protein
MAGEILKAVGDVMQQAAPYAAGAALYTLGATGKKIFGIAESEFDSYFGLSQRLRTVERGIEAIKKAEKMLDEKGVSGEARAAALKFIVPWWPGASLEEDETLHDMWAALLANASLPDGDKVRPSFISILKEMSPDEAELLQFFNRTLHDWEPLMSSEKLEESFCGDRWNRDRLYVCLDILMASRLIEEELFLTVRNDPGYEIDEKTMGDRLNSESRSFGITELGRSFCAACQPPKEQEPKP